LTRIKAKYPKGYYLNSVIHWPTGVPNMQSLPHRYQVSASGASEGTVRVSAAALADLETSAPPEFGGPSGYWSPETLLIAAVANCFVLSFRAVARLSKLEWTSLYCEVAGHLEKGADGRTRFTRFELRPSLTLPSGGDPSRAQSLLEKAERSCLISNSLSGEVTLDAQIRLQAACSAAT
jgi:organic hydroperoxide reductase OsmC/OhrA